MFGRGFCRNIVLNARRGPPNVKSGWRKNLAKRPLNFSHKIVNRELFQSRKMASDAPAPNATDDPVTTSTELRENLDRLLKETQRLREEAGRLRLESEQSRIVKKPDESSGPKVPKS